MSVISSSVRPPISTSALGRSSVSGRSRVPSPAARIIAFIRSPILQLDDAAPPPRRRRAAQVLRQSLRQIDRAMLSAGAAKGDHQIFEAAPLVCRPRSHPPAPPRAPETDARCHAGRDIRSPAHPARSSCWKRSSRPGLGRLRASKTKPPPLPLSSCGHAAMEREAEDAHRQSARRLQPGSAASRTPTCSRKRLHQRGSAIGSSTLCSSQRRFFSA